MEHPQATSGEVLKQSLKEQFKKIVPSKALRVLLLIVTVILVLGVIVGIVCGSIAIGKCRTAPAAPAVQAEAAIVSEPSVEAEPPVTEKPALINPGMSNDTVVLRPNTPAPETPTPEPTATPEPTEMPSTPEPLATEPPEETYLNGRVLKKGDTDELILTVQSALMDLGYMDADEPTSFFGNQTFEALTGFQRHNGLEPDGVIGEETYAALVGGSAKEYVMQEGDEGDDVKEVQERLYELGYLEKSSLTATFGEKTAAAIRAFQSANKLKVDGKVGAKTLNALYSGDVVGNYYKSGDSDESIIAFQKRLVKLGYLDADYNCTGNMDGKTVSAIKTFQESNGLVRDGCLGPATMEQLNSKNAIQYSMHLGMSGSAVKAAQQRLYKLGYLRSSQVSGYFGETTVEAVKSFQKRNSLSQNGEINAKTLEKLNSSKAKTAPSSSGKKTPTPKPGSKATPTPKPNSSKPKGVEKLIAIAETKIDCKYVRGAKGPDKFDCSGFVYWCLNQAGVKQGYMTSIAWRTCSKYKRINSLDALKRGDIIVFRGKTLETGHVGIYMGNGQMIHASSSAGKVHITDSNIQKSKYWQQNFLMAYRIWD